MMQKELLMFVYRNQPTRYSVEAGITRVSANGETRTVTKVNLVSRLFCKLYCFAMNTFQG